MQIRCSRSPIAALSQPMNPRHRLSGRDVAGKKVGARLDSRSRILYRPGASVTGSLAGRRRVRRRRYPDAHHTPRMAMCDIFSLLATPPRYLGW